jgi:hypothetical protein
MSVPRLLLVSLIVLIVFVALAFALGSMSRAYRSGSFISEFTVEQANFTIEARDLSAVEVWYSQVNNQPGVLNDILLGNAVLISENNGRQIWQLPLPTASISPSRIYVKGYSRDGVMVGERNLPHNMNTWATDNVLGVPETVGVRFGETVNAGNLSIRPIKLLEDSRCPVDVQCIQEGRVRAEIELMSGGQTRSEDISTDGNEVVIESFRIKLEEVRPEARVGVVIENSQYLLILTVRQ